MQLKKILYLSISIIAVSCGSSKVIDGTYISNFADLGFFRTTIQFNDNKTFNYNFSGDLINSDLNGRYSIRNNIVYLKFNTDSGEIEKSADSLSVLEMLSGNSHNYELKEEHGIPFHLKYKIRKEKLLIYHIESGKIVRTSKVYNGSNWVYKKWCLKRIK